jgi:eukaryotic-like serine/threonine-protein kinase
MRVRPPRVPGFVLGARLGGGPTADVFAAAAEAGGRGWAIKVLRDDAANDPTNVQLFRREARAGLAVRHTNLVRVVHAILTGEQAYHLVMERVPGRSLRWVLRQTGWLSPRTVAVIGQQAAASLAALHVAGFVHGDVKPDNLHVTPGRKATLLDLGFAHRPTEDAHLVGPGFVLGTANYIAPELCDRPGGDGPASDVFSLGVTLFELLTGELPYPDGTVEETMVHHRDGRPESLWDWQGGWPIGLSSLVDRMLDRDPAARPTAEEVESELMGLFPMAATAVKCRVRHPC